MLWVRVFYSLAVFGVYLYRCRLRSRKSLQENVSYAIPYIMYFATIAKGILQVKRRFRSFIMQILYFNICVGFSFFHSIILCSIYWFDTHPRLKLPFNMTDSCHDRFRMKHPCLTLLPFVIPENKHNCFLCQRNRIRNLLIGYSCWLICFILWWHSRLLPGLLDYETTANLSDSCNTYVARFSSS
jgi:hypothetical protein